MIKPRIRKVVGVPECWMCSTLHCQPPYGFGETPEAAYRQWQRFRALDERHAQGVARLDAVKVLHERLTTPFLPIPFL